MAKRVRDSNLESRAARSKLKRRGKPYYTSLGKDLHLGYRKNAGGLGKWVVRRYIGDQQYRVETIAVADDIIDAAEDIGDALRTGTLNFWQAQQQAREIASKKSYVGPYRVLDAVTAYRKTLEGRGSEYDSGVRFERHILPVLGDEIIDKLTAEKLRDWHRDLSRSMPRIPKKKTGVCTREVDLNDPEQVRKRQVSANRCWTILRAALNMAFHDGKVASDAQWRRVKPFKDVERSRDRYLTLAECQRLLNACDEDLRPLVRGALETGARYGNLCRLRCGDYNPDAGTIRMRFTKSGKEQHIILSDDGRHFFEQLVVGRATSDPMFGREWTASQQVRRMVTACKRAGIEPHIGFHQLRHTWASLSVMNGMPLNVVANNLGHTDTKMVEKHYGHMASGYLVDQVQKFAPRFGMVEGIVKAIR